MTIVATGLEFVGPCLAQRADQEPCEGCTWPGRTLTGPDGRRAWYQARYVAGHHDENGDCRDDCWSQWIEHTAEQCRATRAGLAAMERSLGFPPD